MTSLRAFRKTLAVLGIAVLATVGACFLPYDSYQNWRLLDGTIQDQAHWIYERTTFDPTPIDVAFIGPSRVEEGVDAPALGRALAAQGLPSHVVNFALPEDGRDLNYVVAKLLLAKKQPKLLVIGVGEKPLRFGHPAFKYLADPQTLVDPGYLANAGYLQDLIYLPFRQMRLFASDVIPGGVGLSKTFDPAHYAGASIETAGRKVMDDGSVMIRNRPGAPADQARCLAVMKRGMHRNLLPARYAAIEFGQEHHFITAIAEMARAKGVRVAFLAVPYYTGPTQVQEQALYQSFGPVWNAGFLSPHGEWYADCAHLDGPGAHQLTTWLVAPLSNRLAKPGATP